MKSTRIKLLAMAAVATLVTVSAQANTITGSMWFSTDAVVGNTGTGAIPANVPLTTPDVTFSTSGDLNFSTGSAYTVGEFLSSGNGSTILTGSGNLGQSVDNTIFNFIGQVTVSNGENFTLGHDDGATLIIGGVTVVNAPGPTSLSLSPFTWTGASGTYNFQLVYAECCGAPADLVTSLPLESIPDSGSTMALLGGALTMMGVVARRFRK
jgi:hypothetical protein